MNKLIVAAWLAAICIANWTIVWWGPQSSVYTAFLLIGFNLTSRDILHEAWHGKHLRVKMLCLIAVGGILSWLTQPASGRIVMASVAAFAVSELVDVLIYERLFDRTRMVKMNGSNVASAAVDSILFPTLAFGAVMPWIICGQFLAKTVGGLAWSILLRRVR